MRGFWIACTLLFWALVSFRPAYPQAASGTITGTVLDPSGAVVPKANVIITNVERGVDYKYVTTANGLYEAQFLPPGEYSATVEAAGFKKAVKTGLILVVGQTMSVGFQLEVGASTQAVEVRASVTQLLKPDTSEVGQIITSRQIVDLPLNGRNFADLIPLNAGVTTGMQDAPNNGFNFNGNRSDQNSFLIEGVDNVDQWNNLMMAPSLDAIQEFQIQTGNFSAEFGRAAGGVVQVQLRSGTNAFHGTVFDFLRNDKLDANGFFNNQVPPGPGETSAPKTPLKRNQFGSSLGGPIRKNKLFFFGDYQGGRQRQTDSDIYSVPTMAERAGDFSQDLGTGVPIYSNALLGELYPACDLQNFTPATCQKLPASALDPAAVKVSQFYPLPNVPGSFVPGTGTFNNLTMDASNQNNDDAFDVKADFLPRAADSFSLHYSYTGTRNVFPAAFGDGLLGPCIGCGEGYDILAGSPHIRMQNSGLTNIHTFTPATVNEFRLGLVREYNFWGTSDGGKNLSDGVGIANVNVSNFTTGLPWFLFSTVPTWTGTSPYEPSLVANTTYQFTDNFSYVRGKHRIKTGLDIRRRLSNQAGNSFPRGFYYFGPLFTGDAFADFLTGRPEFIAQDLTPGVLGTRSINYGFYVQDDFKASPRLTLNLGVRYDIFPGYVEVHNRLSILDIATGVAHLAGEDGFPRTLRPTHYDNVAPRIGFAWTPWANGKTVVRGGYGISYFDAGYDAGISNTINPPITSDLSLDNVSTTTAQALVTISDGLPIQYRTSPQTFNPDQPAGSWYVQDPHARSPYTQYYSLGIERALPGDMALDVSYVGTRGIHLPGRDTGDPAPPGPILTEPERLIYYSTMPGVTSITLDENRYASIYNSLQVKLQKRFSHGLQLFGSYTWAKSMDNLSGSSVTGGGDSNPSGSVQDPFDIDADYARSNFDVTDRFVLAYNYNLPVGRGQHFGSSWNPVVNAFLGGWQLNGIITLATGLPFTVFASGAENCGCSYGDMRADRLANGNLPKSQRKITGWFNESAFTDPPSSGLNPGGPIGGYGNAGRNIIFGPGLANFDSSVFKKFRLNEKLELQFRAEFFNLFNRTNFLFPTSSANAAWNTGGLITAANSPRIGQLALKLVF